MKSPAEFLIASVLAGGLCCYTKAGERACSTDLARDGSHPVKLERTKQGGLTATVRNHPSISDGTYKCESVAPVGEKVF